MRPETEALIVIDVQNDFCDGGALAVPGGSEVVAPINALMRDFQVVVLSQDWHPADHSSFASQHSALGAFQVIDMPYGPQVLWPDHCVQGTPGAEFHPGLELHHAQMITRKGFRRGIDSYSAFYENDHTTPTGLDGYLKSRSVQKLTFVGLALDFCVQFSAVDAAKAGFSAEVRSDLCRAIDLDGSLEGAKSAMAAAGVVQI